MANAADLTSSIACFGWIVRGVIALLSGGVVFLSVLAHQSFTSTPIERAAPAIIAIADSMESQFRSGILISAIFLSCALGDRSDLVAVRLTRALFNPCFLLQQDGRGRRLGDEGEGFVGENRDLDRENRILPLRPSVELFAEGHDVDSLRTESGADGGRRVRLACRDLQLDESSDLFCHDTP